MPKKIDHDERKEKILQTALKVFAREGYRDSNLSLIAQECGISRPTIYQYFKDKEDIYYYAVKLVTGRMFNKYADYAWTSKDDEINRIIFICNDIMDMAVLYTGEITSLVDVMIQMKREGRDFSGIIMRRTAKLNILFKRLFRIGIANGTIIPCQIDKVTAHIVILLESFCFQLAFLDTYDMDLSKELVSNYLEFFKTKPDPTDVVPR
ncbi:MAG: TetR/AcrR family transcriptional regulator [Sphaerochaetaceae bacterium]|nr:TetR/AcrR family transcriptional regulator [Sphaerochaetaceae bacterium]